VLNSKKEKKNNMKCKTKVSIMHALIGNVGDDDFRPCFYKSNMSAMDRLKNCREISHKHCK